MERLINKLKKGRIYCIASEASIDKSKICTNIATSYAANGDNVLYLSFTMDEHTFAKKLNSRSSEIDNYINFIEVSKISIEGIDIFNSDDDYSIIIIDPFGIHSYDIDIIDLKVLARLNNVTILLTTNLASTSFGNDIPHPELDDIELPNKEAKSTLIELSDIIMLAYKKENDDKKYIKLAKKYNSLPDEIMF